MIAYSQAPIYHGLYMKLPKGIKIKTGNGKTHVLQLIKNFYGQNQAGRLWNKYLTYRLLKIGFKK